MVSSAPTTLKFKSRRNEDIRFAGVGRRAAPFRPAARRGLEGAHYGCAHGDDAASLAASAIHGVGRLRRDAVTLAMQADFVDALHAQRRKSAKPHMQRHARNLDSSRGNAFQHLLA